MLGLLLSRLKNPAASDVSSVFTTLATTWTGLAITSGRTAFASDTVLPEFQSTAVPELTTALSTAIQFDPPDGGSLTARFASADGVECDLIGTIVGGTTLSLSGTVGDLTISFSGTYSNAIVSGTITIARTSDGASSEDRLWTGYKGGTTLLSNAFFVDQRSGDDGTGTGDVDAPFATIAKAITSGFGSTESTLRLARGSRWREALDEQYGEIDVRDYGVGPRPILDCSIVVSSWSLSGGYTYTYETTFTPESDPGGGLAKFMVLEDGVALRSVSNAATVEATPGSYYAPTASESGPYTIYIHPRGSTNPTTNGRTYEIGHKEYGIQCGGSSTIVGVMTRAHTHDNGGIVVRGSDDTFDAPLIDDCYVVWGGKHNFYDGGTSDLSRGVRRSVALFWMPQDTTAAAFVAYRISPSTNLHPFHYDCAAIAHPQIDVVTPNQSGPYIAHTGQNAISTTWVTEDGYSNVYRSSIALSGASPGEAWVNVIEDGAGLEELDSIDAVETTPGSYYAPRTPVGGVHLLYVHTTNSDDPETNGSLYEYKTQFGDAYIQKFGTAYSNGSFSMGQKHKKFLFDVISEYNKSGGGGGGQHISASDGSFHMERVRIYNHQTSSIGATYNGDRRAIRSLSSNELYVKNFVFTTALSVSGGGLVQVNGDAVFENGISVVVNGIGTVRHMRTTDGPANVTLRNVAMLRGINGFYLDIAGSTLVESDLNVVAHPTGDLSVQESNPGPGIRGFPTYRSDQTLFDQNSTNVYPDHEVEADAERPIFTETATTITARGRVLRFRASDYVNCDPSDVGKTVVGADSEDSALLTSFDNATRTWVVAAASNEFAISEAISITDGAGSGTTSAPSEAFLVGPEAGIDWSLPPVYSDALAFVNTITGAP